MTRPLAVRSGVTALAVCGVSAFFAVPAAAVDVPLPVPGTTRPSVPPPPKPPAAPKLPPPPSVPGVPALPKLPALPAPPQLPGAPKPAAPPPGAAPQQGVGQYNGEGLTFYKRDNLPSVTPIDYNAAAAELDKRYGINGQTAGGPSPIDPPGTVSSQTSGGQAADRGVKASSDSPLEGGGLGLPLGLAGAGLAAAVAAFMYQRRAGA